MTSTTGTSQAAQAGGKRTATGSPSRTGRFAWARYPEFWIILLVAAFLRLWHLDHAQWLDDQAQLLTLARDAWLRGALPVTGIRSSISTLNPPLSIYILMPFLLFTKSPLPALIGLALWNIFGIALCYSFGLRYFNRRVAFCAALVFACCGAAVNYSRFIWQQNYLPPLLLLWAFTLYAGVVRGRRPWLALHHLVGVRVNPVREVVRGRRPWLALHLLLLTMIIALHPTGLTLLAVTVVALLIAPQWPTRRDTLVGLGLVALLLLPTLIWELASNLSDAQLLREFTEQRSTFNFDIFLAFNHLLGAPAYPDPGRNVPYPSILDTALYARIGGLNALIQVAISLLYSGCYLVLAVLTLAPLRRVRIPAGSSGWRRLRHWLAALRQALQMDARWRSYVLLWVWLTVPPLTMLRHGKTVQPHYLFILYPALFLLVGVAIDAIIRAAPRLLPMLRVSAAQARKIVAWAALTAVLVVALGQAAQTTLFIAAVGGNQVSNVNFGYPLNQLLAANNALAAFQRETQARGVVLSMPSHYTASAITSILVREHDDRTGVTGDCLVLSPAQASPALIVSTRAASPQARLLASLPNASHLRDYPMPGDEPFVIYRMSGQTPLLPGEHLLPATTWQDGQGDTLRLVAGARTAAGVIRLRWVVEQWTIRHAVAGEDTAATPQFEIQAQTTAEHGAMTPVARATCQPTRVQAGETIFTWVTTAWSANGTDFAAVAPPLSGAPLTLAVMHGTQALWQGKIGPLPILSAASGGEPLTPMTTGAVSAGYQLPASLTGTSAP